MTPGYIVFSGWFNPSGAIAEDIVKKNWLQRNGHERAAWEVAAQRLHEWLTEIKEIPA